MSDVTPDVPANDVIVPEPQKSWMPTKKFVGAGVIGAITIAAHALASSGWDATENAELMTLLVSLATAYFVPNLDTPGGVPVKDDATV